MLLKLSAWLSLAVGVALAGAQLLRNWDNLARWPTWAPDVAVAVLLAFAGYRFLRRGSDRYLTAGWGVALGIYLSAYASHRQAFQAAEEGGAHFASEELLVLVTAGLTAVALGGLVLAVMGRKPSVQGGAA